MASVGGRTAPPPQKIRLCTNPPESVSVILFVERVFPDVTKDLRMRASWMILTDILMRETQIRSPGEDRGRLELCTRELRDT